MNNIKRIVRESIRDVISESLDKLHSDMVGHFIAPNRPRVRKNEFGDVEYISPNELSGESVKMKRTANRL